MRPDNPRMTLVAVIEERNRETPQLPALYQVIQQLQRAEEQSEYQVEKLLAAVAELCRPRGLVENLGT